MTGPWPAGPPVGGAIPGHAAPGHAAPGHAGPDHRAPTDCPVCGQHLVVTRLGCGSCGTELAGIFAPCEFCALSASDLDTLRVFLASRGNLREVEKHLGVSYPTARLRFSELLGRLGLAEPAAARPEPGAGGPARPEDAAATPAVDRAEVLARVATGTLTAQEAARLLA